jgi:hypothetical protein
MILKIINVIIIILPKQYKLNKSIFNEKYIPILNIINITILLYGIIFYFKSCCNELKI